MKPKSGAYSGISTVGMVPRTALVKKIKTVPAGKNIFLSAPGGYGKSVCAAQWLSSARGKTAYITAADSDNNPETFYKRIAAALLNLTKKHKSIKDLPETGISFDNLLNICRSLPEKSTRLYFVLDDLHIIKNEEIINNLPVIAAYMPGYVCCLLVSRSEPTEAFVKTGLIEVIGKDALLFSPDEVEWLGAEKNRELNPEQIKNLLDITGGWAMYLSVLLSGEETAKPHGGGAPQTLMQYLETKVWKVWDYETKALLLKLAVPSEITPELCERMTGEADGRAVLERLTKKENAFLTQESDDIYCFHDIFHDFLLERTERFFDKAELRRLNGIAAEWYYEQKDYYAGAKHYLANGDHEGISRCISENNLFYANSRNMSVENNINFVEQFVKNLPLEFISENPYLVSECLFAAFQNGNVEDFQKYLSMIYQMTPLIAEKYPEHMETVGFECALDFRIPMNEYAKRLESTMPPQKPRESTNVRSSTMTQNLPYFHRSMRDYSEYHELKPDEIMRIRNTFGAFIGKEYEIMENLIIAGILYERGELLESMRYALTAHRCCADDTHQETVFSANTLLSAVLYAVGAEQEASGVMDRVELYIDKKAPELRPNFKALKTERAVRAGDTESAEEWLTVYANRSNQLPFYQMCRHFTTLRSHIAIKNYEAGIEFGNRLQKLAADYNRPLDRIESGLLTSAALWKNEEKSKAVKNFSAVISLAAPYDFTQLFVNEGEDMLPLLWEMKNRLTPEADIFTDKLTQIIYKKYGFNSADEAAPNLTVRQRMMLSCLSKGMTYNEIADLTGIERSTVKYHVLQVYKRLGVHSMNEAVAKAKTLGLMKQ